MTTVVSVSRRSPRERFRSDGDAPRPCAQPLAAKSGLVCTHQGKVGHSDMAHELPPILYYVYITHGYYRGRSDQNTWQVALLLILQAACQGTVERVGSSRRLPRAPFACAAAGVAAGVATNVCALALLRRSSRTNALRSTLPLRSAERREETLREDT